MTVCTSTNQCHVSINAKVRPIYRGTYIQHHHHCEHTARKDGYELLLRFFMIVSILNDVKKTS